MSTENRTIVGKAILEFDAHGNQINASFTPMIKVTTDDLLAQIKCCTAKSLDDIKQNAQLLLSMFFNKISEIELRDIEASSLEAEILQDERYDGGAIKRVEIDFIYSKK